MGQQMKWMSGLLGLVGSLMALVLLFMSEDSNSGNWRGVALIFAIAWALQGLARDTD